MLSKVSYSSPLYLLIFLLHVPFNHIDLVAKSVCVLSGLRHEGLSSGVVQEPRVVPVVWGTTVTALVVGYGARASRVKIHML